MASPPLPAAARGGPLPALRLGQFGPQKSVRELSARAGAPRGAGCGARPTPVPDPARDPRPPRACPAPVPLGPAGRVPRPLAHSRLLLRSPAGRRAGAGDPPPGAEAWQAGG